MGLAVRENGPAQFSTVEKPLSWWLNWLPEPIGNVSEGQFQFAGQLRNPLFVPAGQRRSKSQLHGVPRDQAAGVAGGAIDNGSRGLGLGTVHRNPSVPPIICERLQRAGDRR